MFLLEPKQSSNPMQPQETAARYDTIAQWWQTQHQDSQYGLRQLERAIQFVDPTHQPKLALEVGCGSSGRFIECLSNRGFQVEGLDISIAMIDLAQQLHPEVTFYRADICEWIPSKSYSLIVAWDSTFHLPLDQQAPVHRKLCAALEDQGILMFTCGGGDQAGEIAGVFQGQDFEYSTLGIDAFLKLLSDCHCTCLHLEYDQYPERHVYVIAKKVGAAIH
ncbi:class I SAM-dependent methyltransferase [Synechococcus elongatus]|uniref:class I SAM-dependent methyltransferase n=1 Tax=Synechococcus elongatus TaxID=32046 RepID=UPI000F7D840C|nr:class I SAM-dependent methyltransferase [Synechococcus elongatus]